MKQKKSAWKVRTTILYFDPQAKMTCKDFIYYSLQRQLHVFEIMAHVHMESLTVQLSLLDTL